MSDYLCEDLVVKILERLPVKSLVRFRSLSKSWYACISDPDFIRMHTLRSAKTPHKALVKHVLELKLTGLSESYTYWENPTPGRLVIKKFNDIIGSCNGVICLLENEFDISLWNPSIRRKLTLPHHPFTGSYVAIGFGFDSINNDYKIVRISYSTDGSVNDSFVYSLKTRAWCAIASPTSVLYAVRPHMTCVNGVLHWMVKSYIPESSKKPCDCIMTFDISTQIFGRIPLLSSWAPIRQLISFEGSLALWTGRWIRVIRKDGNNDASLSTDLKLTRKGLEAYNLETGVRTKLIIMSEASCFNAEMSMCAESLELLDTGTRCNGFIGCIRNDKAIDFRLRMRKRKASSVW